MPPGVQNPGSGRVSRAPPGPSSPLLEWGHARWINGELLPDPTAPAVRVTDHGLTVGDGVFEAIKVVDGLPFALTRHLERLARSARGLGLPEVDDAAVRRGVAAVLDGQDLPLGRIRITYTGGPAPLGSGRGDAPPTLVVVADTMGEWPATTAVATVPWPRNERGALAGLKTTSYAENVVALAKAQERGASEAIFANTAGHLCEGTGSNVFYVVDGELRTPTLASGCLAGITRALVLEWYGGTEVDEPLDVVDRASEVFLVSTTRDVQGVSPLGRPRAARPGPGHHQGRRAVAAAGARAAGDCEPAEQVVARAPSRSRWVSSVPAGTAASVRTRKRCISSVGASAISLPAGDRNSSTSTPRPASSTPGQTWTSPRPAGSESPSRRRRRGTPSTGRRRPRSGT